MALNFPSSPSNGDVYNGFEYDGDLGVWRKLAGIVKMLVSDTKPEGPANGDVWFDSSDGKTYVFYNDGDSAQWIEFAGNIKQGIDGLDGLGITNIEDNGDGTLTITYGSGDETVVTSDLTGPQGPQGPAGADGADGAAGLPSGGTTGQVLAKASNTDADVEWADASSGLDAIKLNENTISANYTIPSGYNGLTAGPVTIADGVTVTIADGSAWSIV